jgi:ribonuclease Z
VDLYFLGTNAGMPTKERNVSSVALRMFEERGSFWLFDCGEGTQHQILHSPLKLSKLEKLFVTHLHGDHLYGLPGLLTSRSYQGGETELTIYGPKGIKEFIETAFKLSKAHLEYEVDIHEIEEGLIFRDKQFAVYAARLEHRIESFGYRIEEKDRPGKLNHEKLAAEGIAPGPIYSQIKLRQDVTLTNGILIRGADYVGPDTPGRIVVIMGDTRECESQKRLAQGADVVVHEATFAAELHELAHKYFHTTSIQAADLARETQCGALILTHFSSRYKGEETELLLEEARKIFSNTHLAHDHWTYYVSSRAIRQISGGDSHPTKE